MAKKHLTVALPAAAPATGAAIYIGDMTAVTFAIGGTFDASFQVQCSFDGGVTYVNQGSAFTDAGGTLSIPDAATHLQVACPSDFTSNTSATAGVGGVSQSQYTA